jgi:Tol biopolymer transport system component
MKHISSKIFLIILVFVSSVVCFADTVKNSSTITNDTVINQRPTAPVEMAGIMYENGKIYVVVLVLLTIFAGIILFLIFLERKISKLENNNS